MVSDNPISSALPENGWLSPEAEMHAGDLGCHTWIADKIFPHSTDCQYQMDLSGWWKLTRYLQTDFPLWTGFRPATVKQRKYIRRWCKRWTRRSQHGPDDYTPWFSDVDLPNFRGLEVTNAEGGD